MPLADGYDDGDLTAQDSVTPLDEQSELTCTSLDRFSESGPPAVPPSTTSIPATSTTVAISSTSNTDNLYKNCRDVLPLVNRSASTASSTVTRQTGLSNTLERQLSGNLSSHGSVKPSTTRPRTFISTADLANHYGIPTILPPAPRPTPRRPSDTESPPAEYPDFTALSTNYLNMLNSKSQDNTPAVEPTSPAMDTANVTASEQPLLTEADIHNLLLNLAAGEYRSHPVLDDFPMQPSTAASTPSNSPAMPPPSPEFSDFLTSASPFTPFTPFEDELTTPLFADSDMFTGPLISDAGFDDQPLFGGVDFEDEPILEAVKPAPPPAPSMPDTSTWLTMSPVTPSLETLDAPAPSAYPSPAVDGTKPLPRRRNAPTGTRKNVTPESLVPLDAPTQARKYTAPSATSRKEMPVTFARKRARAQAFGEEEQLEEAPGPNATEKEQIEWKRRQNTLAARKSRKRKLEHQQLLEDQVQDLASERDKWKTRALTLQNMLHSHGIPFTQFTD
ncbi:hypothetical protein ONZ45_g341 [Pleurotus djamor]|nr:hypothetical protein ONZ45_g341 [Pleurotus djamor]